MRTVEWSAEGVRLIDQRQLPQRVVVTLCRSVAEVATAIRTMQIRGAPAIGACAAYGLALGAQRSRAASTAALLAALEDDARQLAATRPTAVNLAWALARGLKAAKTAAPLGVTAMRAAALSEAEAIAAEDATANRGIGAHGQEMLVADGDTILTHCNTGGLACVAFGTALGVVRAAHDAGKAIHVLVGETRPHLQGARLTAWELAAAGISHTLITDSMAGHFMQRGSVQKVIVGADRIAANGDVANKIGTYSLAVLAHYHSIPFYVAAPTSTIDLSLDEGSEIPIEERSADEVLRIAGTRIAPEGTRAAHPAFDVTPHQLVTAIVTEFGVAHPPYSPALAAAARAKRADSAVGAPVLEPQPMSAADVGKERAKV